MNEMPLKPNSFVPALVEQVFSRYSKLFEEQRQNNTFTTKSFDKLFAELDTIFGDDLKLALRLLDEQIITIYTTDKELHEIVEITEGRSAKRVVKLFSNINYCQCQSFTNNVLRVNNASSEPLPDTHATTSSSKISNSDGKYTCHHVLALRLAKILQAPCIRKEILPSHKFNFLLKQINPIDSTIGGDILNTIAQHMN